MKKRKLKKKFKLFLILYCTIFTSFFIVNSLAKYYGQALGNGNVSIAKWSVSLDTTGSNTSLSLIAGNTTDVYNLSVISNSDTKVDYKIVVSGLPNGMQVGVDGATPQNSSNGIFVYNGFINANDATKTKNHTLTFNAPVGIVSPGTSNVDINVLFTQGQP